MKKLILFLLTLGIAGSGFSAPVEHGKASFYTVRSNGGTVTASGQKLRDDANTVAHRYYPLGTKLKITNLTNDKSEICTVIDRGPYIKGRIVDVTLGLAKKLGMVKSGVVPVRVEVVGKVDLKRLKKAK